MEHRIGDVVNGYRLGADFQWHEVEESGKGLRWLWIGGGATLLVVGGLALLTTVPEGPVVQEGPPSQGFGSKDASADVAIAGSYGEDMFVGALPLTVTNNSEKASDYWIEVAAESADGSEQYDVTTVFVERLQPGQVKQVEATFFYPEDIDADARFVVVQVSRTASL